MTTLLGPAPGLIPSDVPDGSFWEAIPAGEAEAIADITAIIEGRVRDAARTEPPARRDAHAKMHGCVEAEFRVLDGLPPELAQGLFAQPAAYPAWVRFSNGSGSLQPDRDADGRGMAIKVMGVEGSPSGTQDFLMINNPAFFVRDASDYAVFNRAANPLAFFVPDVNPLHARLRDMFEVAMIASHSVSNPLSSRYWSMTPYLYGDRPCKYSARPHGPASPFEDRSALDFLHDNLVRALGHADAAFDFCIQLRTRLDQMPIEDPTIEWPEADSPFVPVARLTIPQQVFDTPDRRDFGENLSFTPWHGLDAHRPLGGINRVRRAVYEAISRLRHELNGTPPIEPTCPMRR